MNKDIKAYNNSLAKADKEIGNLLAQEKSETLAEKSERNSMGL